MATLRLGDMATIGSGYSSLYQDLDYILKGLETITIGYSPERGGWVLNRIFYLGVHPTRHKNVGDFAQVLGIRGWFQDYFPSWEIIERDKGACLHQLDEIEAKITKHDLIFIHSGGDMGDRYLGWERARMKIVRTFPHNKIISLPQTIHFGSSLNLKESAKSYNAHKDLTIMARDRQSYKTATEHFDKCKVMLIPDFALYLNPPPFDGTREGTLVCLRKDRESALDNSERSLLYELGTSFDTSGKRGIAPSRRRFRFEETMTEFQRHKAVITDRFHGMIFAHMAQTPCLVLPTCDHKVTSGLEWFGNQMQLVTNLDSVPDMLKKLPPTRPIDWTKHFAPLKARLFHDLELDYRDALQLIKHRRSIRKWKLYPVEENELRLILEAGAMAPSGSNDQRLRLLSIQDSNLIKQFCVIKRDWTTASNPQVIVLVLFDLAAKGHRNNGKLEGCWSRLFWQDTAAAMENMMLMAESLGLSTCWVTLEGNREVLIKELLNINEDHLIACTLFLGYGDQKRDYETAAWIRRPIKRDLNKMILSLEDVKL